MRFRSRVPLHILGHQDRMCRTGAGQQKYSKHLILRCDEQFCPAVVQNREIWVGRDRDPDSSGPV